ncbi:hypothetical protein JYU34_010812 [Plutella xylostella]|uniref:Uncharacterized protein n=1 Tax=Plutella xylostella TaxID=51655 RepID=A0ABQ7QGI5_PLUXY|nr:hypothetical protein JYU34_010812 [Plutella xylostella]
MYLRILLFVAAVVFENNACPCPSSPLYAPAITSFYPVAGPSAYSVVSSPCGCPTSPCGCPSSPCGCSNPCAFSAAGPCPYEVNPCGCGLSPCSCPVSSPCGCAAPIVCGCGSPSPCGCGSPSPCGCGSPSPYCGCSAPVSCGCGSPSPCGCGSPSPCGCGSPSPCGCGYPGPYTCGCDGVLSSPYDLPSCGCFKDLCNPCDDCQCKAKPVCACLDAANENSCSCTKIKPYIFFPEVEYPLTLLEVNKPFYYNTCYGY